VAITRKTVGAIIVAALLIVGLAPGAFAASEDSLLTKLNNARTSRGLAALESHWDLADDAEAHSRRMMDADHLHHNPNLGSVTSGWLALGENVGVGPSAGSIHTAFMDSSSHRANILGDFTHVGIGAVRESDSKLWVTVVFMKAKGAATTTTTAPPTTTVAPPPTTSSTTTTSTAAPVTTTTAPPTVPTTTVPTTTSSPTAVPTTTSAPSSTLPAPPTTTPGSAPVGPVVEPPVTWAIVAGIVSGAAAAAPAG
jgi:hypothetical protein